ncbi:MAG: manganese efflux pump MntP family protein [Streptosporangiaceae bacterium]
MYALLLVAVSVGLSNFAAAIAIGTAGVDARTRLRVGLVFGVFEAGMPLVGLLIGDQFAGQFGHAGRWVGAAMLISVGVYGLINSFRQARSGGRGGRPLAQGWRLLLSGLALSIDNLVVGFALGNLQVPIVTGVAVIGAVSVGLSLIGLELGARVGKWAGERGEQLGSLLLIGVGVVVGTGRLR